MAIARFFRNGFVGPDAGYSLLWGQQIVGGSPPDVAGGPTPHPLVNAISVPMALLGDDAELAVVYGGCLSLAALVVIVFWLARTWFGVTAGILAAGLLLLRPSIMSFGVLQYADTLFVAVTLGALLVLARRPSATVAPLVLLGTAGLLRPEAWLFAAVLGGFRAREANGRAILALGLLAAAGPAIWALADFVVTGDPLYSFVGTRAGTESLNHETGLASVPTALPERLGNTIGRAALLVGTVGVALVVFFNQARPRLALVGLVLPLVAAVVEAAAGLPTLGRYLFMPGCLLVVFCAAALTGSRSIERKMWARHVWLATSVLGACLLLAFVPERVQTLRAARSVIAVQDRGHDDARSLLAANVPRAECGPIAVPSRRLIPLVAFWLGAEQQRVVTSQLDRPQLGTYLVPQTAEIRREFFIEQNSIGRDDPRQRLVEPPAGFSSVARNRSWAMYERCAR